MSLEVMINSPVDGVSVESISFETTEGKSTYRPNHIIEAVHVSGDVKNMQLITIDESELFIMDLKQMVEQIDFSLILKKLRLKQISQVCIALSYSGTDIENFLHVYVPYIVIDRHPVRGTLLSYNLNAWEAIHRKYPGYRDDLNENEERCFVSDCFACYEQEAFSTTFWSQGGSFSEYHGKKYRVIRRSNEDEADLCCLPMWKIKFEDNKTIHAYPDEIVKREMIDNGCKNELTGIAYSALIEILKPGEEALLKVLTEY